MRMFLSLVAAWLVASLVFALAWIRIANIQSSLYVVRHVFIDYVLLLWIYVSVLGMPVAYLLARLNLIRWWVAIGVASTIGALFGYFTTRAAPDNPFGLSFSPWNRSRPGFIGDSEVPLSAADNWGSLAFGLIIG